MLILVRTELFGTPLPDVTKHEGIDSFHGANPHGTVRVPEFIDHCITALMQMGASSLPPPPRQALSLLQS